MAAQGFDDSPPRNGVIAFYTVLAVVLLFGVSLLLDSYFAKMMDTEVHEKVLSRGLETAYETRSREQQVLEKSGIGAAMRAYAQRGRSASPLIAPESGAGKAAGPGWSQLKKEPVPAAAAAQPTQAQEAQPAPANPNAAAPTQPVEAKPADTGNAPVAPATRPSGTAAPTTEAKP